MTTDITELALKPTRYGTNSQGVFTNQTDGAYVSYLDFVALVEELKKAQQRIDELDSRTVKLPEPFELAGLSGGSSYYYADEVDAALTSQGIKVEAE